MNIKTFLLNFSIGWLTFAIGIAWLGIYQFFVPLPVAIEYSEIENIPEIALQEASNGLEVRDAVNDAGKHEPDKAVDAPISEEEWRSNLDIQGYYDFIDQPVIDADSYRMEIWLGEYDEKAGEWIEGPPSGFIRRNKKKYAFEKIHYSFGKLTFSTEKKKGIRYIFRGEYSKKKIEEDGNEYNAEVLSDRLIKQKDGRVITQAEVEFLRYQDEC